MIVLIKCENNRRISHWEKLEVIRVNVSLCVTNEQEHLTFQSLHV